MSDVATAGMILALAVLALSYYFFLDKWIQNRVAAILTGVLEGVSISTKDRRMLLRTSWLGCIAGGIGSFLVIAIMWVLIGRQVANEDLRQLAFFSAFFALIGVMNWVYQAVVQFPYLVSVLRQAEAD
jgi:hypothetical protein